MLSGETSVTLEHIAQLSDTRFETLTVRPVERGYLIAEFAVRPVWTLREGLPTSQEQLVIRLDANGELSYALSNASPDTPLAVLAHLKCQRQFVECSIQQAKSDLGWDELVAQRYRAWEHHLALTILASWFIAEVKLDWQSHFQPDPTLTEHFEVEGLPPLSTANIRELLKAVMPLRQFSPDEAVEQVVKHLVNRTRSRRSRLKRQHPMGLGP